MVRDSVLNYISAISCSHHKTLSVYVGYFDTQYCLNSNNTANWSYYGPGWYNVLTICYLKEISVYRKCSQQVHLAFTVLILMYLVWCIINHVCLKSFVSINRYPSGIVKFVIIIPRIGRHLE